jgi:hypothetical protein
MSLKKSKAFRIVAWGLFGLGVLAQVAYLAQRALSGSWNDSYRSANLMSWTYGGAFILICAIAAVGFVGLFFYVQRRWRDKE